MGEQSTEHAAGLPAERPTGRSFGAESTAADVTEGVDLRGKRAVVTGGSSGIGLETARALAAAGAEVTIAVRDVEAGARAAAEISAGMAGGGSSAGPSAGVVLEGSVLVEPLDLADRASIASFVGRWSGPLDILVDNAGIMAPPEGRTPEGWELQFATNHLGHFALTVGLHDALAASASASASESASVDAASVEGASPSSARVVVLSSRGHLSGDIDLDDPAFMRRGYDRWAAYSASKTANVLFAVEAARRWASDGIAVNAVMPGRIRTGLMRFIGDETTAAAPSRFAATDPAMVWKTIEQGAATSALLAASPLVEGVTGRYFEDCREAVIQVAGELAGVADYAVDPERAARLWEISERMVER